MNKIASPDPATRVRLPTNRDSFVLKYKYWGQEVDNKGVVKAVPHKGQVIIGLYDDGVPGECFVLCEKMGSTVRGMLDAWAITLSIGLQCGVPLDVMLAKVARMKFPPDGRSENPEIGYCSSPIDAVVRTIAKAFAIDLDNPGVIDEDEPEDDDA